jgi:hypothetical protein
MKRLFLFFVAAVMAAVAMMAQSSPIRWRINVKMTSDTEGVVTVKALVQDGWHLYGTKLPDNGPKPTSFSFTGTEGVKFTGKLTAARPADKHDDPMFGLELSWWDSNIEFTRKFKVTKREGAKIVVTPTFMGCNNITCLKPSSTTLTYTFK